MAEVVVTTRMSVARNGDLETPVSPLICNVTRDISFGRIIQITPHQLSHLSTLLNLNLLSHRLKIIPSSISPIDLQQNTPSLLAYKLSLNWTSETDLPRLR